MQIPGNPLLAGPGFLNQPQPGTRQQVNPDLQAKAAAPGAQIASNPVDPGARAGARSAPRAAPATLEQAVRTLSAEGRLPPRGSLVDLRA